MAEHCDALPLPVNGQPASRRFPDFQTNIEPYRVIPVRLFLFPVPFPAGIHGAAPFSNRFPARSDALSRFSRIPGRLPTVFSRRTPTVIAGPPWYTFGTPRIHMVDAIRTNQRKGTQRTACPDRKSPHASRPGRKKGSKTDPKKEAIPDFRKKKREPKQVQRKTAKGISPLRQRRPKGPKPANDLGPTPTSAYGRAFHVHIKTPKSSDRTLRRQTKPSPLRPYPPPMRRGLQNPEGIL